MELKIVEDTFNFAQAVTVKYQHGNIQWYSRWLHAINNKE